MDYRHENEKLEGDRRAAVRTRAAERRRAQFEEDLRECESRLKEASFARAAISTLLAFPSPSGLHKAPLPDGVAVGALSVDAPSLIGPEDVEVRRHLDGVTQLRDVFKSTPRDSLHARAAWTRLVAAAEAARPVMEDVVRRLEADARAMSTQGRDDAYREALRIEGIL